MGGGVSGLGETETYAAAVFLPCVSEMVIPNG
jgi:hypothetical protein